jgi:hypothetical protein
LKSSGSVFWVISWQPGRDARSGSILKRRLLVEKWSSPFGSALNLNVHFHMLFLDGVYTTTPWGKSRFHRTNAPGQQELVALVHAISHRVAGFLERDGILERDEENSYLNREEGDEDPMQQILGCSVSYRIAVGSRQGRKVFTLLTIPAWEDDDRFAQVAKVSGFSLHAGVAAEAGEACEIYHEAGGIRETAVTDALREYSLSAQNAL